MAISAPSSDSFRPTAKEVGLSTVFSWALRSLPRPLGPTRPSPSAGSESPGPESSDSSRPDSRRPGSRANPSSVFSQTHDPVVATDDEKIAKCCRGFGADVIMTSGTCKNGTERCNEALKKLGKNYDIVVSIQGDEPLIEPDIIDGVVKALQGAPDAVFSTAVTSLKPVDALDPNRVKCVVNNHGYAIYFSRGLILFNKSGKVNPHFSYSSWHDISMELLF